MHPEHPETTPSATPSTHENHLLPDPNDPETALTWSVDQHDPPRARRFHVASLLAQPGILWLVAAAALCGNVQLGARPQRDRVVPPSAPSATPVETPAEALVCAFHVGDDVRTAA